ncbi:tetratricopeptide repeat protein [Synechococcus sp. HB1133]|uniref:tetratricopeptide repeat protein n=1 Tax=unclassified Synechococcus TaxID=2626047 RepID=UPI00140DC8D2|nr:MULTISPECIES: tetratricopeptide repeat protein [unclassified Synechococcus]MCB4421460.1 tetratricopeptide repeat protein [Synechococcus sp. HB1133]MCB4431189.1 tetratricopeptide repeat protein [Synechococcus sp. HBA1120]NHI80402.1 tetratricopeptide repeat protein [Synechococcus sp. HB1133]
MNKNKLLDEIVAGSRLIEKDPSRAIELMKGGLKFEPKQGAAWFNLGIAYHQNKMIEEAIRSYKTALECEKAPEAYIKNNLAQDLLLNGNFNEGWEIYEQRLLKMKETFGIYESMFGEPWQGPKEQREFDQLLVVAEQGFGDTIQFCRLILLLQKSGINTKLFCPEPLAELLRKQSELENICISITGAKKKTLWIPLMSLPKILSINERNIPFGKGYIAIDETKQKEWREKLDLKHKKRLIGIHWQGNANFEKKIYSRGRSINIESMKCLEELDNVQFISLQKGEKAEEKILLEGLDFVEGQKLFDQTLNFRDTAGVIANCDYVISSDSSVVHLAGSMNIKTITALSYVPEWRWLKKGTQTKWYESMVLYRQDKTKNWSLVFRKIVDDLNDKLKW